MNIILMGSKGLNELLNWVIFNHLIGNADAQVKNISLMLTPTRPMLAPFYDLMSTAIYPNLAPKMAMKIGGEDRPDWIMEQRWKQFSEGTGIKFKFVRTRCWEMADTLSNIAVVFDCEFQQQHGDNDQKK